MKEYIIGNATVVIHRPSLTAEEQTKREGHILTALQLFGKAMTEADGKAVTA